MPAAFVFAMGRHFSPAKRLTAMAVAALMLATIVFTKSRGGALGLIVMFAALVFLSRKVRPGIGAVAVAAVLVAIPFMPSSFWTRMQSIVDDKLDQEQFTGSREARRLLIQEGINAFLEYPLTGVGAGQFKNYNPAGRQERWNETHNALLQVAAETGIFGLAVFLFLIFSGARAAATTRRLLGGGRKRAREPNPLRLVLSETDRQSLYAHTLVMTAGLIGWFVCSFFASVAYNWTFYYLLAPIVCARELTMDRLRAGQIALGERPASVRRRAGAARLRHA
jgi:O-antigen ligase